MSPYALSIEQVSKYYSSGKQALNNVSLQVKQGDFFALLGPNGAGKSTLISIIATLLQKNSGKIKLLNHDLDTQPFLAKRLLGLVPQEFNCNIFQTPQQILFYQAGYYGLRRKKVRTHIDFLLKSLGLWDKRDQPSRSLSGGMKRRLMIARALVHKPRLLLLDEPTVGVDIAQRRSMWDFLQELNQQGTSIILTTHYLEEAEALCERIAIIDKGQIIENTSRDELLNKLTAETFILEADNKRTLPKKMAGCTIHHQKANQIEVSIPRDIPISQLFKEFTALNIQIFSIRNKANRLETLFLQLTTEESNASQ